MKKTKKYILYNRDCLKALRKIPSNYVDSCVCDPPYGLGKEPDIYNLMAAWLKGDNHEYSKSGFMGKSWDSGVPGPSYWNQVFRVLKPGGYCLVFAGTRTYDLMTIALRFAGFEIRDTIRYLQDEHYPAWVHGQGFPKSLNISKGIDKKFGKDPTVVGKRTDGRYKYGFSDKAKAALGKTAIKKTKGFVGEMGVITKPTTEEAQQWEGWGSSLKPAWEPIIIARKPLEGSIVENILAYGTGGINIDGCRIAYTKDNPPIPQIAQNKRNVQSSKTMYDGQSMSKSKTKAVIGGSEIGRFPANVIHDGSDTVVKDFARFGKSVSKKGKRRTAKVDNNTRLLNSSQVQVNCEYEDSGTVARFFFCAKASTKERSEGISSKKNTHPTVKPTALMQYLVRLVTPKNGICLDPFMGSGTTGVACMKEGFRFIGVELEEEYYDIAIQRIDFANKHTLRGILC